MLQGGIINVVQESFEAVKLNSNRFTRVFYDRLFELQPEAKEYFSKDIRDQRKRFFKAMEFIIFHIDEPHLVVAKVNKVKFWPDIYNVKKDGHYIFFSTFIYTLSAALGSDFTPYVRHCWVEFCEHLDRILEGAEDHDIVGQIRKANAEQGSIRQTANQVV